MTALAAARNTPTRANSNYLNRGSFKGEAAQTFYIGALVCLNAGGFLVNGTATTGLKPVGIFGDQPFFVPSVSFASGAQGANEYEVLMVQAKLANSGSDPVVQGDIGNVCYIEDNQTVCHTSTGKSIAGRVMGIDASSSPTGAGVWVEIGENSIGAIGSTGAQGAQGATGSQGPQGPQGATGA